MKIILLTQVDSNGLMAYKFTNQALTKEQLGEFGFGSEEEFQSLIRV